jgi:histone-lysine N-methyltransferase SETD2/UMP-CMP kinase
MDFFKKNIDLSVVGTPCQIELFSEVFSLIEFVIRELKKEMGIVEGQIKVPIIYLKRLITIL